MKKIRDCLHKHGLHFPNWIQLLFWTIGICILLTLTVVFSIRILMNYYDEDSNVAIKTQVTVNELLDSTLQMEALVPYYLFVNGKTSLAIITDHLISNNTEQTCRPCQQLKNISWDVWNDLNFTGENREQARIALVARFIDRMMSDVSTGINPFTDQHHNWTWALLEAGLWYFGWKWNMDSNLRLPDWTGTDKIVPINLAYSNTTWNGSRIIDLLQYRLLEALCRTIELTVTDYEGQRTKTCQDILMNNSLPVVMTDSALTFIIPANNTQRHTIDCTFWRDGEDYDTNLWTPPSNWIDGDTLLIHREPLYSRFWNLDDPKNILYFSRISVIRPSRRVFPTVAISYFVSTKIKEERKGKKCNAENDPKRCQLKCSKNWFTNYCKCIPYTFRHNLNDTYQNLPYCTEYHYTTCNWTAFFDGPLQDCVNDCSNPCTYTGYSLDVAHDITPPSMDKVGFRLVLRPIIDPYIEFSRTAKDGLEDLMSNLGGIIGIYLGASVFTLVIIIVSCVDLIQSYRRKKAGGSNGDEMGLRAIHLWQMVLMNNTKNRPVGETNENTELQRQIQKLREEIEQIKSELFKQTADQSENMKQVVQGEME